MKILSKNTTVLTSSFKFSEDGKKVTFQANTELYVEGNPHANLITPETIFGLECLVSKMANIQTIAEEQVSAFVSDKYKI